MNVLPFSRARFTPADMATFREVAEPRLGDGRWAACRRGTGRSSDRIEIFLPGRSACCFSFERDAAGGYSLYFHDAAGPRRVSHAETAAACLYLWKAARRPATGGNGAGRTAETG